MGAEIKIGTAAPVFQEIGANKITHKNLRHHGGGEDGFPGLAPYLVFCYICSKTAFLTSSNDFRKGAGRKPETRNARTNEPHSAPNRRRHDGRRPGGP